MAFKMGGWSAFKKETNLPEEEQQRISDAKPKGKFMKVSKKLKRNYEYYRKKPRFIGLSDERIEEILSKE